MIYETLQAGFKQLLADKTLLFWVGCLSFVVLCYSVYVALSLRPSDIIVAAHYTFYGETNYYRQQWFYLLSFIGSGVFIAVFNSALAVKLRLLDKRPLAIGFVWLSIGVVLIGWLLTASVLNVAFLS